MSTNNRRRRLVATLAAVIVPPAAAILLTPLAGHADEEPVLTPNGTICWEKAVRPGGIVPVIVVHLSEVAKDPVTVVVDTIDGTAVAPDDYTAITGLVVTIPAGASSVKVPLDIKPDAVTEPDETFFVSLSKPSIGRIGKNPATVVIKDGGPPADGS